jgi:predicted 3-demethylubiquinone-9 3-methyltransferase (glyoxalase superfamily)
MQNISMITPCLWFDDQAEEAAEMKVIVFVKATDESEAVS